MSNEQGGSGAGSDAAGGGRGSAGARLLGHLTMTRRTVGPLYNLHRWDRPYL